MRHPIKHPADIPYSDKFKWITIVKNKERLMKITVLIFLFVLLKTEISAQDNIPKIVGIVMIGNSGKPILDFYIVDSTRKDEFKFDEHTVALYTDKNILNSIYSIFQNEKKADSLTKYKKSFGTFDFYFQFQNGDKFEVIANRIQSAVFFQKIICELSSGNNHENLIVQQIKYNLSRINY